uniref:Signal recognition particle 9 kDa protein n=1 Tax=Hanusia phi TaxID=3032 RepID=A0A7S0EHL1_9CRYP|mmetsp:Transcript_24707/g.55864  ORF Transcript_24707/g.55864 Transcript_24707/m.55864 type:complete len:123 (+) Transcript_24707:173-541(+)
MVYINHWDEFMQAAQELLIKSPDKTRYLIKYRHIDAQLVLKVTDDVVCIKYKTDQSLDVKKMERLNHLFLRLMPSPQVDAETSSSILADIETEAAQQQVQAQTQHHVPAEGAEGKKKKKKGK